MVYISFSLPNFSLLIQQKEIIFNLFVLNGIGVVSVALHGPEKDKLMIVGDGVDAVCLTSSLRKKLSHASLETVEEVKDKKVEDQKKDAGKKDEDKKDSKAITPIVCCQQPQLEFFTVVPDPHPSPCTIL